MCVLLTTEMASRKRFSVEAVLKELDLSDDNNFSDNDSDRESDIELDDIEPDSDGTEDYEAPVVYAGSDSSDSGSGVGATVSTPPTQVCAPRVWNVVSNSFQPKMSYQYSHIAGLSNSINITAETSPIDFFKLLLTEEIVELMVTETNRYADQFLEKTALKPKSRAQNWQPTTVPEMNRFLGLIFLMGYVTKPRIEDYWSTDKNIATPVFNESMTRDRFELLLKFWHFSNNEEIPENDRLFKLGHICELLLGRFQDVYTMERDVSIDESMVLWRGRLHSGRIYPGSGTSTG